MSKTRFKILANYNTKKDILSEVEKIDGAMQISSQRTKEGYDVFFSVKNNNLIKAKNLLIEKKYRFTEI